ncbi:PqqD family protein [Paracoccus sp. Ld10]|uniref:PqqD family protein n=1 Tax=Paracoccus sp. Ld10 TaxID=649158 RepID=UPI00386EE922
MTPRTRTRPAGIPRQSRDPDTTLHFPGTGLSLRLRGAQPVHQALMAAIHGWQPQTLSAPRPGDRQTLVTRGAGGFSARSPFFEGDLAGLDAASAACALMADLSEGFVADRPSCMALHCGAFRFAGDLILLTGPMRAGKSTLIGRLTAEPDVTVFCDDVLPLTADLQAVALGIAPRLRLPLPNGTTPACRRHVAATPGPRDRRYAYLAAANVAPHGTQARPGTLIVLDRRDIAPATLHRMDPDQAVRHLLAQNMADLGSADQAFATTHDMAAAMTCLRLVYADLEDAVALLRRAFAPHAPPQTNVPLADPLADPLFAPDRQSVPVQPDRVMQQSAGIVVRQIGSGAFLWTPSDPVVWHLNPVGHAVWALLAIPGSATDLAVTLAEVFADVPRDRLTRDIAALMGDLLAGGFITG